MHNIQFITIVIIIGVLLLTLTFYKYISHEIFSIEEVNGINITVIMGSSQFILGLLIWLHYKRNQDHKNDSEKKKLLDTLDEIKWNLGSMNDIYSTKNLICFEVIKDNCQEYDHILSKLDIYSKQLLQQIKNADYLKDKNLNPIYDNIIDAISYTRVKNYKMFIIKTLNVVTSIDEIICKDNPKARRLDIRNRMIPKYPY